MITVGTALQLDSVSVTLGGRSILTNVSLDIDVRRLAVIGANGSGKSTFARLLNGLVKPSSGRVMVRGVNVADNVEAVRRQVGFIFSSPDAQILMPTVAEDVALSLRASTLSRDEVAQRVGVALTQYGLAGLADAPAYTLSGGQKQLLALASALITQPALVVADEPTTLLDLHNTRLITQQLLEELECDLVLVTHDLDLAAQCDQVALFASGHLVRVGDPSDVITEYRRQNE